jgi:hypothetical protein
MPLYSNSLTDPKLLVLRRCRVSHATPPIEPNGMHSGLDHRVLLQPPGELVPEGLPGFTRAIPYRAETPQLRPRAIETIFRDLEPGIHAPRALIRNFRLAFCARQQKQPLDFRLPDARGYAHRKHDYFLEF